MVFSLWGCGGEKSASVEQEVDSSKPDFHSWFEQQETTVPVQEATVPTTEPTLPETQPAEQEFVWMEVIGDNLNVRTGPGMEHEVLWRFHTGDFVKIYEVFQGWGLTEWGWISLEFTKDYESPYSTVQSEPTKPDYYGSVISVLLAGNEDPGYGLSYLYDYYSDASDILYALVDLDGNGQKELLLTGKNDNYPFDCFTVKNGKTINVFSSGARYPFYVYEDGYIVNHWSGGASNCGTDYYRYKNGKLTLQERFALDADYAVESGAIPDLSYADAYNCWFRSTSEKQADYVYISQEEVAARMEARDEKLVPLDIYYMPITEYFENSNSGL